MAAIYLSIIFTSNCTSRNSTQRISPPNIIQYNTTASHQTGTFYELLILFSELVMFFFLLMIQWLEWLNLCDIIPLACAQGPADPQRSSSLPLSIGQWITEGPCAKHQANGNNSSRAAAKNHKPWRLEFGVSSPLIESDTNIALPLLLLPHAD